MLVKNIILKVCDFLENKELFKAIKENEFTQEQAEEIETFVKCLNLVRNEIASEMISNAKLERVKTESGKVYFSSLEGEVIEILSVKDSFGNNLVFEQFPDYISTGASEVIIKYNASPEPLTFESEFTSTIPERVYAYGIVREYYYIQTLYEDASVWEERFKNSIQSLSLKKSETVIPRRRWS